MASKRHPRLPTAGGERGAKVTPFDPSSDDRDGEVRVVARNGCTSEAAVTVNPSRQLCARRTRWIDIQYTPEFCMEPSNKVSRRPTDRTRTARDATDQSPEELHEELVEGAPGSDYDRSLARESDFGGGFGQGHYTGTSWDPELRESPQSTKTDADSDSEEQSEEEFRAPRTHPKNVSGSAGAGKLGGVPNAGLTTGGSSKHSS
jgi:hypothetical protein